MLVDLTHFLITCMESVSSAYDVSVSLVDGFLIYQGFFFLLLLLIVHFSLREDYPLAVTGRRVEGSFHLSSVS